MQLDYLITQLIITYQLDEPGWSRCTIKTFDEEVELTASDLSDALGSLVLAAVAILSGFRACTFKFDEEPGQYRWIIEKIEPLVIKVEIREFDDYASYKQNDEGKLLINLMCSPLAFAQAVYAAARQVLEEYGMDGYKKKWVEHEFPERQVEILGQSIAAALMEQPNASWVQQILASNKES